MALLIKGLYPADLPTNRDPDFIDNVFDNRAGLRRAGSFEISEGELSQAEDENDFWHRTALANQKEIVELKEHIRDSDAVIAKLLDRL